MGCGVQPVAETIQPTPAPTPKAELYIRETIEPTEVSPDAYFEDEVVQIETYIPEEVVADPEEESQEAEDDSGEGTGADDVYVDDGSGLYGADREVEENAASDAVNAAESDETTEDEEIPDPGPQMRLWGVCTLSFYCPCEKCCGQWAGGATASGTTPTPGRTVACELPFGTRLMIEGHEYVVEDRGVSGMWVDIFVGSHEEALQRGLYQTEVYIVEG